jgi:hypothetical protein
MLRSANCGISFLAFDQYVTSEGVDIKPRLVK